MAIINNFPMGTALSRTTATAADVLQGKQFYTATGNYTSGTIPVKSSSVVVNTLSDVKIPMGYYNGNITCKVSDVEKEKITPQNIKKDITILGVTGEYVPEVETTTGKSGSSNASGHIDTVASTKNTRPKHVVLLPGGTKTPLFYTFNSQSNKYETYYNDTVYNGQYTDVYDSVFLISFDTPYNNQEFDYIFYSENNA